MDSFRSIVNAPGVAYDVAKTDILFAEDLDKIQSSANVNTPAIFNTTPATATPGQTVTAGAFTLRAVVDEDETVIEGVVQNSASGVPWTIIWILDAAELFRVTNPTGEFVWFRISLLPGVVGGQRFARLECWDNSPATIGVDFKWAAMDISVARDFFVRTKNDDGFDHDFNVMNLTQKVARTII